MGGILTRWVVQQEYLVAEPQLDAAGAVRAEVVGDWLVAARDAYLDQCVALRRRERDGLELRYQASRVPDGALSGRPAAVSVSASAAEVRPTSFRISVRVRPGGGERDTPLNAAWTVTLVDPRSGEPGELGDEVRAELIALEHSARHFN